MGLMAGAGAVLGITGGIFQAGKKVKTPQYVRTDTAVEQQKAVEQNTNVLPAAENLAGKTNLFNQSELMKSLRGVIPNIDAIQTQVSENLLSRLKGEIPEDVKNAVLRNSAGQAVYGGFANSGAKTNLDARDLGMTSLQISNQALDSAGRWIAGARASMIAPQFDITSMFVTPGQRIAQTFADNQGQFARNMFDAQVAAQPDPTRAAIGKSLSSIGGSMFGAGLGGMSFGGGGGAAIPSPAALSASGWSTPQVTPGFSGAAGFSGGMYA